MSQLRADLLIPSTNRYYNVQKLLDGAGYSKALGRVLVVQPDHFEQYDSQGILISSEPHSLGSRAELRNKLIHHAVSQICICIDSDILVYPGFIEAHVSAHQDFPGALVAGPVYARKLNGQAYTRFAEILSSVDPAGLKDELSDHPVFCDPRSDLGVFQTDAHCYSIGHIDTAWSHMWTWNISFPRDAALAYGGFDAGFSGWGLEDVEFAYRFFLHGADLVVADDAWGIHQYHDRDLVQNQDDYFRNLEYFFSKWTNHDIEFLRLGITGAQGASLLAAGLVNYDQQLDIAVIQEVVAADDPHFGRIYFYPSDVSCAPQLASAGISHAFLPHIHTCKQPYEKNGVTFWPLVGMSTPFADEHFDEVVVLQNKLLHFNTLILRSLLVELSRIAKRVLLYSSGLLGGMEKNTRILGETERTCGNKLRILECREVR